MNVLSVIWRYKQLKKMTPAERAKTVPRVVAIGGKAASGERGRTAVQPANHTSKP